VSEEPLPTSFTVTFAYYDARGHRYCVRYVLDDQAVWDAMGLTSAAAAAFSCLPD